MTKEQETPDPQETLANIPALLAEYPDFPDEWIDGKGDLILLSYMGLGNLGPLLRIKIDKEQFQYIKRVEAVMDERGKENKK